MAVPRPLSNGELRKANIDPETVEGFGREWATFDQRRLSIAEMETAFERYFRLFPWGDLPPQARGFDFGCGSGRWARQVAPRVGTLHCVDASGEALAVARRNLASHANCVFHECVAETLPFADGSMDFGFSLGVLHHIPDPASALSACVRRLKPGAPFLVYLYYRFDNRPAWYRALWWSSELARTVIARLPHWLKVAVTSAIAAGVYWPAARVSGLLKRGGSNVSGFPLSFYRNHSFYTMRTDALDRFGTRLEQRFTAEEVGRMMDAAGLERVEISPSEPFWCAIGFRASPVGSPLGE
jgi:SAM-dependent methyltransferase